MQTHIEASKSALLPQLDYSGKPTAGYVLSSRQVRFYPQGSNSASPAGLNVIRITLGGTNEWLDPSTLRIAFTCVNQDPTHPLRPRSYQPSIFFTRMRVLAGGGTPWEDIFVYSRHCALYAGMLETSDFEWQEANAGFGGGSQYQAGTSTEPALLSPKACFIPANGGQLTVMHRPCCGLTNRRFSRYLPLQWAPLTFELYLDTAANSVENDAGFSTNYSLTNFQVHCTVCELDSSVSNAFARSMLEGKSLSFPMNLYYTQLVSVPLGSTSFVVSVVRALTRLCGCAVTYSGTNDGAVGTSFLSPMGDVIFPGNGGGGDDTTQSVRRDTPYQLRWQIESRTFPETQTGSLAELWYQLTRFVRTHDTDLKSINIDLWGYANFSWVAGMNFCRVVPHGAETDPVWASGLNTRSGGLMTIQNSNMDAGSGIAACYVHLIGEGICTIDSQSCQLFD